MNTNNYTNKEVDSKKYYWHPIGEKEKFYSELLETLSKYAFKAYENIEENEYRLLLQNLYQTCFTAILMLNMYPNDIGKTNHLLTKINILYSQITTIFLSYLYEKKISVPEDDHDKRDMIISAVMYCFVNAKYYERTNRSLVYYNDAKSTAIGLIELVKNMGYNVFENEYIDKNIGYILN